MRDLNIDFVDLYKSVDRFIKDAYSSSEGISEYLRQMEFNDYKGRRYVPSWDEDHDKLKRLRWIRNQLSHEVEYDSDICDMSDYDWLRKFKERLYSSNDPLSVLRKSLETNERSRVTQNRQAVQNRRPVQYRDVRVTSHYIIPPAVELPEKKTLWQKIKSFFFGN